MRTIKENLMRFNNDNTCQYLSRIYQLKSMMEILSVTRTEMQHSAFIAWLLEGKDHECSLTASPLVHFLDLVYARALEQKKAFVAQLGATASSVLERALLTRNIEFQNVTVKKEKALDGARPDIVITADVKTDKQKARPLTIVIENKVLAVEGEVQTPKHSLYYKGEYEKTGQHDYIFVYLTPITSAELTDYSNLPENRTCKSPDFIHVCYQDIVDKVIEPLLECDDLPERSRFLLKEYEYSLSYPTVDEENHKRTVMAIRPKERAMLLSFWNEYRDLIFETVNCHYNKKANLDKEVINYLSAFWQSNETLIYAVCNALSYTCEDWKLQVVNAMIAQYDKQCKSTMYFIDGHSKLYTKSETFTTVLKEYANIYNSLSSAELNARLHNEKGLPNTAYSDTKVDRYTIEHQRPDGSNIFIKDDQGNQANQCDTLINFINKDEACEGINVHAFNCNS